MTETVRQNRYVAFSGLLRTAFPRHQLHRQDLLPPSAHLPESPEFLSRLSVLAPLLRMLLWLPLLLPVPPPFRLPLVFPPRPQLPALCTAAGCLFSWR